MAFGKKRATSGAATDREPPQPEPDPPEVEPTPDADDEALLDPVLPRGPLVLDCEGEPIPVKLTSVGDDPYRPDTVLDGGGWEALEVRAVSLRGRSKRYDGAPRQDDICVRSHEPSRSLLIAVADGVSGAARSHVGAALAVRQTVNHLAGQLEERPAAELDWQEAFRQAAWNLVAEHRQNAGDEEAPPQDALQTLACTIVAAVICADQDGRWTLHAAAIGDSPVLLLRDGELSVVLGEDGKTDGTFAHHRTAALPVVPEFDPLTLALDPGDVVLVATDGFSDPVAGGRSPAGRRICEALRRPPDLVPFAYLVDFSQRSFDDDRTLVAVWIDSSPDE